jgi:hypothetical protein
VTELPRREVLLGRLVRGGRLLVLGAIVLTAVGLTDRLLAWPLLTATVGPTAYQLLAHPEERAARFRTALTGHVAAITIALATIAAFGLRHEPSAARLGHVTGPQVAATAVAVGLTLLALEVLDAHHAPAAATAVLITTGLARPGRPLEGLVLGLAIVLVLAPVLSALLPRPAPPQG